MHTEIHLIQGGKRVQKPYSYPCNEQGAEPVTFVRSRFQRELNILCRSPVFLRIWSMKVSHSPLSSSREQL